MTETTRTDTFEVYAYEKVMTSLYLPRAVRDEARQFADYLHVSFNVMVTDAINEYMVGHLTELPTNKNITVNINNIEVVKAEKVKETIITEKTVKETVTINKPITRKHPDYSTLTLEQLDKVLEKEEDLILRQLILGELKRRGMSFRNGKPTVDHAEARGATQILNGES